MDPENQVVQLCAEGMKAEGEHRQEDARALFERAWTLSTDDYEAAIAAHYVARHQPDAETTFHWNQVALQRATAVGDDRVRGFFPSLYLCLGRSYEQLGNAELARQHYQEAAARLGDLPPGPYGDLVRGGVADALARTQL